MHNTQVNASHSARKWVWLYDVLCPPMQLKKVQVFKTMGLEPEVAQGRGGSKQWIREDHLETETSSVCTGQFW